ncbi:MAG: HAD-IC family P-type ATPase, partial [Pseudomonadota bacterium]
MSLALAKPETRNTGLTTIEAEARLAEFGPNKLPEPKSSTLLELFGRQFLSPFIYILIGAAIVALAVGQIPSAIFITAVLFINAGIGTYQEYAAQQSSAALRKLVPSLATVVRDGKSQRLPVETIVPGDLVMLASGDKVPADIALGEAQGLSVDESMLTGESIAVEKTIKAIGGDDHALETNTIADRNGEVFAGSVILRGRGVGLVRAIGLGTAIGQIAESLSEEKIAEPPLVRRIRHFTHTVAAAIGVSILALFAIMALRGGYTQLEMLLMAVGLAVSAIPEGLPAALTVALAVGMNRMAQRNVIIRRLVAVEALGSCTFICSDKTGTLTVNELTIRRIVLPDGSESEVEGQGLSPIGSVQRSATRAMNTA